MIYTKHFPDIIKPLARDLIFDIPNQNNAIYLTFDDGPHPEITPWVLDQLEAFGAKATFFMIGSTIEKYPTVVNEILGEGHAIGNHSYSHISGWKTKDKLYFDDVDKCSELLDTRLFRPPYGQITLSQSKALKTRFKLIQWSDLSADFDEKLTSQQCFKYATEKIKSGSIVVFHDSEKAWPRLEKMLPKALQYYQEQGYTMKAIPS